jgi:hypothetical protein
MTAVCDLGPLQYLILIGRDHMLPCIFNRVVTARVTGADGLAARQR